MMRILDRKGRLFGILNIIDLAVLLIVGAIIIFGFSRMDSGIVTTSETKTGTVTYEIADIRQVTVDQINVGDPVYHYDKGTYIGTISNVEIQPFRERIDYNGRWVEADVPRKFVALIDVEAELTESEEFYTAGGEQTRVGIQYRLKNKNFASFGVCVDLEVAE